jgi:peptidoglycan biosynthesis protein MviN/MurJ (putative lipid II flippase)
VLFLGTVGLSTASAVGAWSELIRLRGALRRRLPDFDLPWKEDGKMILCALAAAVPGALVWWRLPAWPVQLTALIVLGVYALSYFAVAKLAGLEELDAWLGGIFGRLRRLRRSRREPG